MRKLRGETVPVAVGGVPPESVAAQVIPPALEQRRVDGHRERPLDQGQITIEELVLQCARIGGDDHLASRQEARDEIGEGLAGPGAGLAQEHAAGLDRFGHDLRHLLLLWPRGETLDVIGQGALGRQDPGRAPVFSFARAARARDRVIRPLPLALGRAAMPQLGRMSSHVVDDAPTARSGFAKKTWRASRALLFSGPPFVQALHPARTPQRRNPGSNGARGLNSLS